MSIFANLSSEKDIQSETDSLGGGVVLDSDLYDFIVKSAFITTSEGGAMALNLHLKTDDDREVRQQLWMTSGKDKGQKNYYEKDGQKKYLPGFMHANSLCMLIADKEIKDIEPEEKVLKVYSTTAKAEVPTKVPVLTELLEKHILVGMLKVKNDVNKKGDDGKYYPTGETREDNEIDKMFHPESRLSTTELFARAKDPDAPVGFADAWLAKNKGTTRNKAKGAAAAGTAGAPKAAGGAPGGSTKPTKSLFGNS